MDSGDLTYLRAEAEQALPTTVSIERAERTEDGQGGYTEAWRAVYQDVPARLAERTGREGVFGSKIAVDAEWVLTLPYDQGITAEDRVVHDGASYEVAFVNEGRSYDTVRRVLLRRVA